MTKDITFSNSLHSIVLPKEKFFLDFIKVLSRDVLQKFFTHGKVNSKANNNIVNSILNNINSNQTKEQSENAAKIRISINDEEGNVFKKFLAVYVIDHQVFKKQDFYQVDNKVLEKLPYLNIRLLQLDTNNPHKLQDADVNQLCDELVQHCPKIVTTLFALCFPNKDIIKSWSKFSPRCSVADIWNNKNQALEECWSDLTLSEFQQECFPYYSVQHDNMNAKLQEVFIEPQEPSVNKGFFSSVFSSFTGFVTAPIFSAMSGLSSLFGFKKAAPTPEGTIIPNQTGNSNDLTKTILNGDNTTHTSTQNTSEAPAPESKSFGSFFSSLFPSISSCKNILKTTLGMNYREYTDSKNSQTSYSKNSQTHSTTSINQVWHKWPLYNSDTTDTSATDEQQITGANLVEKQ